MALSTIEETIETARHLQSNSLCFKSRKLATLPESIGDLVDLRKLDLSKNQLTMIPDRISNLASIIWLDLSSNRLANLPEDISKLVNLMELNLAGNALTNLPNSICNLVDLTDLNLANNQLTSLPTSIRKLINLRLLDLTDNPLTDLSILEDIVGLRFVHFLGVHLPRRYWTKFSKWKPEWLLDEDNAEIRRILIKQLGYEQICDRLNAITLNIWREYTLLRIDGVEVMDREPMVLLKMTCPSTAHLHILRVPPEMVCAETAITWVNYGIHPDKFEVQT
jgi:leucine-rich repeat protein SHOC2